MKEKGCLIRLVKACNAAEKEHNKNTELAKKYFGYFKKDSLLYKLKFYLFYDLYQDKFFSLPYCEDYFGNMLTLSLDLCEWDITKFIIKNNETAKVYLSKIYGDRYQLLPIDYLDNLRDSISDQDKIKLDEISKLLEETQLTKTKQKY